MTIKLSPRAIGLALIFLGCTKSQSKDGSTSGLVSQVHAFFDKTIAGSGKVMNATNYRANQPKSLLWDRATLVHLSEGDAVSVPIAYRNNLFVSFKATPNQLYRLNDIASLVITRDSNNLFHAAVVTFIPDSSSRLNTPSGLYFVEDWDGNTLYSPIHIGPQSNYSSTNTHMVFNTKEADYVQSIQVCNEIDGYNYSPDDPSNGIAWSETSCTTYGFPAQDPAAGIPVSRLTSLPVSRYLPPLEVIVSPPSSPINSIADYYKCFTQIDDAYHQYSVTLAVEQPVTGSRQPWSWTEAGLGASSSGGNPFFVGHTYLIFSENSGGLITARNVGFYPSGFVAPGLPTAQGALGDDENTGYDVSLTVSVTSQQFFQMLNYTMQGNNVGYDYNLNSNNCTTFALDALDAGGVAIPATVGTWPGGGQGLDPGDLGEDIRGMHLSGNMTRSTVDNSHPNAGNCNP
jgi:hypothetical protein